MSVTKSLSNRHRKHLIIASYDGISTHYCGVGTTLQDTLWSLQDLTNSEDIKISLAYIAVDPQSDAYNERSFKNSLSLVKKTGGSLIPLSNGTSGYSEKDMWSSFPEWEFACASLATAMNMVLKKEDDNVLMLHDTPFLLFHKFKQQIFDRKLRCFYMPRSSGMNYKFGDKRWREHRIRIEKEAFQAIQSDHTSMVLAIGKNFGRHLADEYGLSFTSKEYLLNGFYSGRYSEFLNKQFDISALRQFGINLGKESKIIFCWGRASVAKGVKELLEAWQLIFKALPDHCLVVQAPNNSGEGDYFRLLKKYEKQIPRTIVLDDYNPHIWQTFLRLKNTSVVCLPSIMDPNPHTAIEAKLFSINMNFAIVCSNVDGIKDTYSTSECLWSNPYDKKGFSRAILKAAKLSDKKKLAMREANARSSSEYDYSKTIKNFLEWINFI